MRLGARGGPGDFDVRLARCNELRSSTSTAAAPLDAAAAVLRHQRQRARAAPVVAVAHELVAGAAERRSGARFPLLDLDLAGEVTTSELAPAFGALAGTLPHALAAAAAMLGELSVGARAGVVEAWMDDPDTVEPTLGFWVGVAAAPPLEAAASAVAPPASDEWTGAACPLCGGRAQVSVIAEESGEFMGGSPRNLVCSRCATWWPYPRITCAWCGEEDPRQLEAFVAAGDRLVRIDACTTCHGYTKTFDLREPGGAHVVPLIDDIATVRLDVWAQHEGYERSTLSLAGV